MGRWREQKLGGGGSIAPTMKSNHYPNEHSKRVACTPGKPITIFTNHHASRHGFMFQHYTAALVDSVSAPREKDVSPCPPSVSRDLNIRKRVQLELERDSDRQTQTQTERERENRLMRMAYVARGTDWKKECI